MEMNMDVMKLQKLLSHEIIKNMMMNARMKVMTFKNKHLEFNLM